ncbi:beta-ketoacyl synthase N-terminal-like domain-containing protein [Streptomyces mutabilis]|uniref:beta-ketoacyl synthase N-terminal-like domain-containing protein n=1 Tax=Streptomyces mutabilis TaxID=67332 RepID=UPI001F42FF80|nr:beta-ketoacyl synthase N-terminal-like domain-containing protein [Streptomyces mutabilis]
MERLAIDENFQEFGFDSISLVEFAGVLSELLGIDVTPDLFFSHTTLRGLHAFLLDRYGIQLEDRYGTVAATPAAGTGTTREPTGPQAPRHTGQAAPARRTRRAAGSRFTPAPAGRGGAAGADEQIAVVGMSGRFPSARGVDDLWRLLVEGRSAVATAPVDRDPSWADGKERRLGWVPGIAEFDPRFFEIAPSEAETMDPRQRLLLEEMWKALEDAGCGREQLAGQEVGVFVGVEEGDYRLLAAQEEGITSNHNAVLAARLSYFLDLTGPGVAVNTACSSGLVALHEACLSLRHGDCDTAIVAGVNLMATPREYDALDGAGMLSSDGVCRAFDRRADGMVPGEAVAVVVLKRRDAAERDRHPILARILGTGINNDGRTNGITAPSGQAQTRLVREVQRRAGVSPETVDHIVTHGTGTRLGDPVEINALTEAFRPDTERTGFCALTSTKPAVGHSLAASGLVSLIALILSMRHETIPPSANCEQISDFVRWQDTPFHVNRAPRAWPELPGTPRRGAVSAFGFSGTNAHVVLESHGTAREDLTRLGAQTAAPWHLLPCSAKTDTALAGQLRAVADWLAAHPDAGPGLMRSVSHTLMAGRHHFARRCALVVRDREDAVRVLRRAADAVERSGGHPGGDIDVLLGTVARDFTADPEGSREVRDLAASGPGLTEDAYRQLLDTLARSYCQGHDPAGFAPIWGATPPERMSMPGYVFDHADYWVTPAATAPASPAAPAGPAQRLHPLVHRNTSDLNGQRYTTELGGDEPWFTAADEGRALGLGAQLELVRAAVVLALGEGDLPISLRDVAGREPVTAHPAGRTLRIDLRATADGTVDWALYAHESAADGEPCPVADGSASRAVTEDRTDRLDLAALRARCTRELSAPAASGAARILAGPTGTAADQLHLLLDLAGSETDTDTAHGGADTDLVLVPQLLDTCLGAARAAAGAAAARAVAVTRVAEAAFAAKALPVRWGHVVVRSAAPVETVVVDATLAAADGTVVARLSDVTLAGCLEELAAPSVTADVPAGAPLVAPGEGRRPEMRGWTVPECLAWELADAAGRTLKIPADQLDPDENLANFGFDSLNITKFATDLSKRLGFSLTPDVFFSHPTLGRLATHLLTDHADRVDNRYREGTAAPAAPAPERRTPVSRRRPDRLTTTRVRPGAGTEPAAPVAIVGMSGRFPDARSVDGLWSILADGRNVIREVPEERLPWWRTGGSEDEDRARRFGAVPGIAEFDPLFFEMSPREAELMDPRQRLLLQEMWHALEDAGYGERALAAEKVGIFVGVEEGDYRYLVDGEASVTSNSNSVLAARLAYFLDLTGPSMAINTSCSSGLVALHEACLSLRYGDCDTAIVAGASLMASAHDYLAMEKATMLAPDRTCYAFDRRAGGMVPGEAVAVLVLRRLPDAERDGNRIHATVLGSGINYDGRTNGLTAPSGEAQSRLLRSVYERHGIAPDSLDYIVAHGTGTRLGDPIEVNALVDAFRAHTDRTGFCALTSVKPNIGHSMAASGLVNLIALASAMRHETIPPSINCEELSDFIDWDASPFFVNREARRWPASAGRPRRGAVSSFGVSGTNAHVVLQAYDEHPDGTRPAAPDAPPSHLLLVSAKDEDALIRRLHDLADHLETHGEDTGSLASVSRTLMTGRVHFAHRCALVIQDRADAVRLLREAAAGTKLPRLYRATVARRFAPNHTIHRAVGELVRSGRAVRHDAAAYQDHLAALAEFYCQGYTPAFEGLWDTLPSLAGLPLYPFAVEHHWAPAAPAHPAGARVRPAHPLVTQQTSAGTVHRFSTRITGGEEFLGELLVPAGTDRPAAAR